MFASLRPIASYKARRELLVDGMSRTSANGFACSGFGTSSVSQGLSRCNEANGMAWIWARSETWIDGNKS